MTEAVLTRPELTLPEKEAAFLRAAYVGAGNILEYGSGGSTVLASEMPGKTVLSVESDPDWARDMEAWFAQNPGESRPEILHVDLGPTTAWGYPADPSKCQAFHRYPLAPWEGGYDPDLVLIDGRFRMACFLATALKITRPTHVLWDDYAPRKHYHAAETWAAPERIYERMAHFHLTPRAFDPAHLSQLAAAFTDPR